METLIPVLLPMVALIVALIVVAGLWYWWTSNQPDEPEAPADSGPTAESNTAEQHMKLDGEVSTAERASAIFSSLKSGVSNILSATGSIEIRRAGTGGAVVSGEMIEVLRLYRDLSNGALVVQIGRDKYYSLEEIADLQVRRRFLGNAEAMAQFAQLKKGTSPLIDWTTPPTTVTQERPTPVAPPTSSAPPPPPSIAPAPKSADQPPMQPAPSLFSSILGGPKAAAKEGDKEGEEPAPKSMADEIEELLQYRLALDSALAQRSVHIRSSEDGSIMVEVDDTRFDSVGDVTDPDIKAFLQKVVQEWEARK